jgi:hypothetical protein
VPDRRLLYISLYKKSPPLYLMAKDSGMKIFNQREIVFLTKHKKDEVVRPILENETGCTLIVENRFDTDQLGTFTREIKRPKSQLDTARMKIEIGMRLTNTDIGVASEGSFGSHPLAPIPLNIELVLLYDQKEDMEIYGLYEGVDTNYSQITVNSYDDALKFAEKTGFPSHYLILRPDDENSPIIMKNIDCFEKLSDAFQTCQSKSKAGNVFLETDMRAHANPTRMRNIEKAAKDLVAKLMNLCPQCSAPGFQVQEVIRGLPCEWCGLPSEMARVLRFRCHRCKHEVDQLYPRGQYAPAQYCNFCNP